MSKLKLAVAAALLAGGVAAIAQPGPTPQPGPKMPAPDVAIAAAEARATVADLAAKLEESYVFPDTAKRYAAMLREKAASGAYDGFTSGRAFAERVTADLRAVAPDNHLRMGVRPPGPPPGAGGHGPRPRPPFAPIEEARRIAPGVAYIRFNMFPGDPETVAAVRRFMTEHADAEAIIFDNRTHRGGGLAEMDAMFPYLFGKPTTLVTMDTRASVEKSRGGPPMDHGKLRVRPAGAEVVRRDHYVEPEAAEKRLFGAKVFVLTSGATASAAEHMTLSLKRTRRATIIGEPTAGAGHYGGVVPVGEKFGVFIPVGRTFDPDTGKDWEGGGIEPDVAVPAAEALTEALVRSGVERAEAVRLAAEVKPTGPMTRRNPRPGA
jgi:hypothetical protein